MVETALVLPIIFLLCFGVLEYGYRFMKQSQLNNYSYIAARSYSIPDADGIADITTKITEATPDGATAPTITHADCPEDPDGNDNAVVDIDATWPSVTGLLGFLPGINGDGTVNYHAEGVARCGG
jgi:Flp pilus assembly protein TadG